MRKMVRTTSKTLILLTASALLASCSSLGGLGNFFGSPAETIDENQAVENDPLKRLVTNNLPTPVDANGNPVQNATQSATQTATQTAVNGVRKIVAPKVNTNGIIPPKITPPKVVAPVKKVAPVVKKPVVAKPKPVVVKKPTVVASKPSKIAPNAYRYTDLFKFREDMNAGRLQNATQTASLISRNPANKCKLEAAKFTCFVNSLNREAYIMVKN